MTGPLPFFHFGSGGGSPLAIIAGGLILDSGEAERSFIYRCQDRFLSYATLMGVQTVFFAIDEEHVERYRQLIARLGARFRRIAQASGLFEHLPVTEPLYLLLDPETLAVTASRSLPARLAEPDVRAAIASGIALNQISPGYASLVAGLAEVLRAAGLACDWDEASTRRMADMAMRYQDKAQFVHWVDANSANRHAHLPTLLLELEQLQRFDNWPALTAAFADATGAPPPASFFLKTARNTSGNLSRRLTPDNWRAAIGELAEQVALEASQQPADLARLATDLATEVAENPALRDAAIDAPMLRRFKQLQAELRRGFSVLLQPDLSAHAMAQRPAGIGLSFLIDHNGCTETIAIAAQSYRDPAHHAFRGSFLSSAGAELGRSLLAEALNMCRALAAEGYRGPISFDACLAADGYRFIHDCNPRLTGVFPTLAVSNALLGQAIAPTSILTLGYRGEFVASDIEQVLAALEAARLLLTPDRAAGVVMLPNLCRDDGFDLHLVGISPAEATRLLGAKGELSRIFGAGRGAGPIYI